MAKIFIESRPAVLDGNPFDHLYLVFQDDNEDEFVIRGGPEYDIPPFGQIVMESSVPIEESEDARGTDDPVEDRGQVEIDLDGRNAEDIWSLMLQHTANIQLASLDYDFIPQNSNSVVASLLHAIGIDLLDFIPTNTSESALVGEGNLLTFDRTFDGTSDADLIQGYTGADEISGANGNDTLYGGDTGNDTMDGGTGNDILNGLGDSDILTGSEGNDQLYGGSGNDVLYGDGATSGAPVSGEIVVDNASLYGSMSAISDLPGGGFVVAWREGTEVDDKDVQAKIYDDAGGVVTSFQVNASSSLDQNSIAVTTLSGGFCFEGVNKSSSKYENRAENFPAFLAAISLVDCAFIGRCN